MIDGRLRPHPFVGAAAPVVKRLCAESDIPEGEGRGFAFGGGIEREAVFVIRWQGKLFGYRNSCPHIGIPIDWPENRFFDLEGKFLMCGGHGAVFRPEDGYCFEGPCTGRALARIPLKIEGGDIYWADEASPLSSQRLG